ncbi:MAG TPA: hypothetical protein VJC39_05565 [Candidatus Nanoarchaeia archaeon]|nr:hypothetical protein [Candidatus Nanoarchaeia archaeon]
MISPTSLTLVGQYSISLGGIMAGYILAVIAKEELTPGLKYFQFIRRGLFVILGLSVSYLFLIHSIIYAFAYALILSIIFIAAELKIRNYWFDLVYYLFFSLPLFFSNPNLNTSLSNLHSLIPIVLFWYGLPLGTLIYQQYHAKLRKK